MGQRRLLVIASQVAELKRLSFLPAAAERLHALLLDERIGGWVPALPDSDGLLLNPTGPEMSRAIQAAWRAASADRATLGLVFIGHGEFSGRTFFVLPEDAKTVDVEPDSFVDLAATLANAQSYHPHVDGCLVLVDACFSGEGIEAAARELLRGATSYTLRFEMLTASDQVATAGRFSRTLADLLETGQPDVGGFWRLERLREEIDRRCGEHGQWARHIALDADPGLFLATNVAAPPAIAQAAGDIAQQLTRWLVATDGLNDAVGFLRRHPLVTVTGPAGSGKSTLVAALTGSPHVPAGFIHAARFLNEGDAPAAIAEALARQLRETVAGFENAAEIEAPDQPDPIRRLVIEPLSRLALAGPVRIALDGLDQLTPDAQEVVSAALTATAEVENVHVVVTARPGTALPSGARQVTLDRANIGDVERYLVRRGVADAASRQAMAHHAGGSWLLAQLLADLHGRTGLHEGLTPDEAYERLLEDVLRRVRDTGNLRAVLAVLAVVGSGPLLPITLLSRAMTELGASDGLPAARDALVLLKNLAIRSRPGTDDEHVGLAHPTFASYLLTATLPQALRFEPRAAHRAVAAAIEACAPTTDPQPASPEHRYAVRAEAEHQLAGGNVAKAFESLVRRSGDTRDVDRWTRFAGRAERAASPHDPLMLIDFEGPARRLEFRSDDRRLLASWMRAPTSRIFVVTGHAGSGKTAFLRELYVNTWPGLRDALLARHELADLPVDERADDEAFDASVRLTGASPAEVVDQFAAALGFTLPAGVSSTEQWDALIDWASTVGPRMLLVDALDEALQPIFAARLLREIVSAGQVRAVVGTRPSTQESLDRERDAEQDVLATLGLEARGSFVSGILLGHDRDALEAFVRGQLDGEAADIVAEAVATGEREFLFAVIAVREVLAQPELPPSLRAALTGTHADLFGVAVDRLAGLDPAYGAILAALGFARGRGLPLADGVLATVAGALGDRPVSDREISALLHHAAPYVTVDVEDGHAVLRLAHATFHEHYVSPLGPNAETVRARQSAIARELLQLAARRRGPLNHYLARHLTGHVAAGGHESWTSLAGRRDVLDRLDFRALRLDAFTTFADGEPLPREIGGVVTASGLFTGESLGDATGLRQLGLARAWRQRTFQEPDADHRWGLRMAVLEPQPMHFPFAAGAPVRALAVSAGHGTVHLLAAACDDGKVRLWNIATGERAGVTIAVRAGVIALCLFYNPRGIARLATSGADSVVRVWDPVSGVQLQSFLVDHDGPPQALGSLVGPRPRLITGGDDGHVRIRQLPNGGFLKDVGSHGAGIRAIAAHSTQGGEAWIATAGRSDLVYIWDAGARPAAGQPVVIDHGEWVTTLSVHVGVDGGVQLVIGGIDGTVRVWGPSTGDELLTLSTGREAIRGAAAFPGPGGTPRLATADGSDRVTLWQDASVKQSLDGHTRGVRGVTSWLTGAGRPRLATGADDRTVRIWDPLAPSQGDAPTDAGPGAVHAIAPWDGGIVTAGRDGVVRFWAAENEDEALRMELHSGAIRALVTYDVDGVRRIATCGDDELIRIAAGAGDPAPLVLSGHTRPVRALVAFRDGGPRLASTGDDGTIRIWDGATGEALGCWREGSHDRLRGLARLTVGGEPRFATVGAGRPVELWEAGAPAPERRLAGHRNWGMAVCTFLLASGRSWLISGGDDMVVNVWDPERHSHRRSLEGHNAPIRVVVASEDGRIASGADDGTVLVWDPESGARRCTIRVGTRVNALHILGDRLLIGTDDGFAIAEMRHT